MPKTESLALRKLAERVKAGQYIEWPWALLKEQFPAGSDEAALKKLRTWGAKNGVAVDMQSHEMRIGRSKATVRVAVFERQRKPPIKHRS